MNQKPMQWPEASGVFNAPRTLVMASDPQDVQPRRNAEAVHVATPLDLIRMLEDPSAGLVTVVLTGRFAEDSDLTSFLRETYPRIEVVIERPVVELFDLGAADAMVA